MSRVLSFLILMIFVILTPAASQADNLQVKGRIAGFLPDSTIVRDVYHPCLRLYQIELSYLMCNSWSLWTNVSYLSEHGRSLGAHDPTRLRLFPLSVGLNYNWLFFSQFEVYLGSGLTYSLLRIKDGSPYVQQNICRKHLGWIAKSGISYQFCEGGSLELFLDYFHTEFHFSGSKNNVKRHDLNMSGLLFGIGLGVSFQ